jgi:hypothetical protein
MAGAAALIVSFWIKSMVKFCHRDKDSEEENCYRKGLRIHRQ